jgi:hypothetical protein
MRFKASPVSFCDVIGASIAKTFNVLLINRSYKYNLYGLQLSGMHKICQNRKIHPVNEAVIAQKTINIFIL